MNRAKRKARRCPSDRQQNDDRRIRQRCIESQVFNSRTYVRKFFKDFFTLQILQIMRVITCIICMCCVSNVSNASNYLHDFMWAKQVITRIILSICDVCMIQIFKYFESNNNPMKVMRGRFKASIGPMRVMRVFE